MPTKAATLVFQWRADTSGAANRIHLNNAGAALMPASVVQAMHDHLDLEAEMGGYEAADAVADRVRDGYETFATLLGASARNIAMVPNATAGFVQALSSIPWQPGDVLVTSPCDYTSNQIQYLALREGLGRPGVPVQHRRVAPEGGVILSTSVRDAILAAKGRCRLAAISWVPTNSGLVQDVAAIGVICEALGTPFLVDACQAVGRPLPIDVTTIRCDYLSGTARKFLRGRAASVSCYASDQCCSGESFRSSPTCVVRHGLRRARSSRRRRRSGLKIGNSPHALVRAGRSPRRSTPWMSALRWLHVGRRGVAGG